MTVYDLHSHTYYSPCGADEPQKLIRTAIDGGIQVRGITDHNYGIEYRMDEYKAEMYACAERFKDEITVIVGMEVATVPDRPLRSPSSADDGISYVLIEHIDLPQSLVGEFIFEYSREFNCAVGIAHTDLFALAPKWDMTPYQLLKKLAEHGIFWEMNVNYDSIHGYREHEYCKRFVSDKKQLETVLSSGIKVSVGFDSHRAEDYRADRVTEMCRFLDENKVPSPLPDILAGDVAAVCERKRQRNIKAAEGRRYRQSFQL